MGKAQEEFFVKVEDADSLRKNLVEGGQAIADILDLQTRLEIIREEKEKDFLMLAKNLDETKKLLEHLNAMLPKKEFPDTKAKSAMKREKGSIEKELAEIDEKMKHLKRKGR